MLPPASGQAGMAAALLDPEREGPGDPRFAVHRNNVVAGLIGVLAETFPAVHQLVGEAFLQAAAARFVRAHPPASPVLILWGGAFPGWIAAFPPAAAVPYLGDVAHLEWALAAAYNAPEARPVGADCLAALPADALATTRLTLHPSLRPVRSRFPVASLWAGVTGRRADGAVATQIDLDHAETVLIARPEARVAVTVLPAATATFLDGLVRGLPLGDAIAAAENEPDFDLAAQIAGLFAAGLVTGVADNGS